ncbi:response regulator [Chryseolinea sp. T2]|uniref:response regulator n=1 Tax=Chryseolinea sp. T2 TaxID=3129255 RepID=UPI00307764C2
MSKKVILVEDDLDDRELFFTFFSQRKDIVLLPPASNGVELIEFLNGVVSDEELPDLIILDQNMPKMNGKRALSYLKSEKRFANIPVVVYSTYTDSSLIIDCKNLGAGMVAVKPIDFQGYQKMMDDFLQIFDEIRR